MLLRAGVARGTPGNAARSRCSGGSRLCRLRGCLLFFTDFLASLWLAEKRWRYFLSWGWLDLLSSIPALDVGRWVRIARVLRITRVLRGLRATRLVTSVVLKHRAQNTLLAASLLALLLVISCSIAVLQFEDTAEANIRTGEDAIWWSFTTITTVGMGIAIPSPLKAGWSQ